MTYKLYTWPAAMMAAALLAFSPYGCDTQPAATRAAQKAVAAVQLQQDAAEAAYQAQYGQMSDAELVRGDAETQP